MVRYMQGEGGQWFPGMLGRSRYNERARCLWVVLIKLQQGLAEQLGSRTALYEVVDCVPLPSCSTAQSRKKRHWLNWGTRGHGGTQGWYWGDQVVMSVTPDYAITGWLIGPANVDDRVMLQGLLMHRAGQSIFLLPTAWRPHRQLAAPDFLHPLQACGQASVGHMYVADKGFNGFRWQRHWFQLFGVCVVTEPTNNLKPADWPTRWSTSLRSMRQVVETTFALLSTAFDLELRSHQAALLSSARSSWRTRLRCSGERSPQRASTLNRANVLFCPRRRSRWYMPRASDTENSVTNFVCILRS